MVILYLNVALHVNKLRLINYGLGADEDEDIQEVNSNQDQPAQEEDVESTMEQVD